MEVLNVFNRDNRGPDDPSINFTTGVVRGLTQSLFPLLPSVGLLVEFWIAGDSPSRSSTGSIIRGCLASLAKGLLYMWVAKLVRTASLPFSRTL